MLIFRILDRPVRDRLLYDAVYALNGLIRLARCLISWVNGVRLSKPRGKAIYSGNLIVAISLFGFTLSGLTVSPAHGQGLVDEAEALSGLPGLYVLGGNVDEIMSEYAIRKDELLKTVSAELQDGGVPILDEMNWLMVDSAPVVHIDLRSEDGVYRVLLEVLYLVHPVSDPDATTYAVIWSQDRLGALSDSVKDEIMDASRNLAAALAIDYRSNL
jgi:hypothetical protein